MKIYKALSVVMLTVATLSAPICAGAQTIPIVGIGRPLCKHLQSVDFNEQASVGQWVLGYYSGSMSEQRCRHRRKGRQ